MEKKTQRYGMNLFELLLVIFIVLKLVGVINWSWWWVMSPFWIPLILAVLIGIIYVIVKET